MAQNRGEWSELYAILYLLLNDKLEIVDSELKYITNKIFKVKEIKTEKKKINKVIEINFKIKEDNILLNLDSEIINISKNQISIKIKELFSEIKKEHKKKGAFVIPKVEKWLESLNITSNLKSSSNKKEDILLLNLDTIINDYINLGYSVKSQLGSPATILNSSNHTNFKYRLNGLTKKEVKEINEINTRKKLLDRLNKIEAYGGKIKFEAVESETFNNNLKMIDSKLPEALGNILLESYRDNNKNLKILFSKLEIYEGIWEKKLGDFLSAISFGMMPSKIWNGKNEINGGIILVCNNEKVYVLDMIYHSEEVKKYLLNETSLDSPSSTRYDMLNIKEDENGFFFTLNLQVRYNRNKK